MFVYRDWIDECLVHDSPRKQDPFSKWEMRTFAEVTLNEFDVHIKNKYMSNRFGAVTTKCVEDRIPVRGHLTKE